MPDRSKGKGQMKCSPCTSMLEIGRRANEPTAEKLIVMKERRRPRRAQGCNASKEEEGICN
jgi:hypothetical protein